MLKTLTQFDSVPCGMVHGSTMNILLMRLTEMAIYLARASSISFFGSDASPHLSVLFRTVLKTTYAYLAQSGSRAVAKYQIRTQDRRWFRLPNGVYE